MADTKPTLQYKVVTGYNPATKTKGDLMRPLLVNREIYPVDRVVEYALKNGYIRGQFEDMKGAINGSIEAMQQLVRDGKIVNLADWLKIHAELTGTVGESRQVGSANKLHVCITALQSLKIDMSHFSMENVDESGSKPRIATILSPGGKPWEVIKTKDILVTGMHLEFDASKGDTATVTYGEGEEATTINITPTESDYAHMRFGWPAALADVAAGTKLTFAFRTCAGIEGGAVYSTSKEATLVNA